MKLQRALVVKYFSYIECARYGGAQIAPNKQVHYAYLIPVYGAEENWLYEEGLVFSRAENRIIWPCSCTS